MPLLIITLCVFGLVGLIFTIIDFSFEGSFWFSSERRQLRDVESKIKKAQIRDQIKRKEEELKRYTDRGV